MKRLNSTPIETPLGTFYANLCDVDKEDGMHGAYAETESGEVTINGVTYSGTVYFKRYQPTGKYWVSAQHLTRYVETRGSGRFQPASDAAQKKLDEYLREGLTAIVNDTERVREAKLRNLESSRHYALADANRAIEKANGFAAQIRALGGTVEDAAKFPPQV